MISALPIPRFTQHQVAMGCVFAGAVILASEPAVWLVGTWVQPGYDGIGVMAFLMVLLLGIWSATSPQVRNGAVPSGTFALLGITALLRLVSQILDVNVIGALLLCVDVFAIGRLLRLDLRQRAVSPFWLALLFCFCLPIEPMVQRLLGYGLQHLSADVACALLSPIFPDIQSEGVRLRLNGVDVLVDLPCSGSQLLSTCVLLFALINTLKRPSLVSAARGAVLCLILALLGNGLRIAVLAIGIAYAPALPFFVMEPLPHALIGLVITGLVTLGLLMHARTYRSPQYGDIGARHQCHHIGVLDVASGVRRRSHALGLRRPRISFALGFLGLALALAVGAIRPQPVDASPRMLPPELPSVAADLLAEAAPLTDQEARYFSTYGGGAERASYGPFGLLVVSTASPLRHLHDPAICFSGAGFDVELRGTDHIRRTTVYSARRKRDGRAFELHVSYLSSRGEVASSVAEVVWRWLADPGTRWTMVQRIVPEAFVGRPGTAEWQAAMQRAFNI